MILAVIERYQKEEKDSPFNESYSLDKGYKDIFDDLNVLLFPVISNNNYDKIVKICDGLIISGSGSDINPKYYNEEEEESGKYERDEYIYDSKLLELFHKENKPILGICSGLQCINVYFGGSLNQDIKNHKSKEGVTHSIKIKEDSFLKDVYNKEEIVVNSFHHQSIKRVAPGFNVTAISDDGVIEAIEKDNIIGVQWNPEVMRDKAFFEHFLAKFLD